MDMGFKIIDAIKSNNTCEQICKLNKNGILEKIIPEVKSMKEVGKCKYHKVDCFTHTIYALEEFEKLMRENKFPSHLKDEIWEYLNKEAENNLKNIDLLKLGVFLHDIGKANAKTIDENGRVHFKGHEKFSGEIALNVGENLRLSQNSIKLLYNFTRYHMYLLTLYKKSNTSHDVMKEMFDTLKDDIIGVMLLGFADINATKKLIEPIENEEVLKTYVYYILTVYLYKYKKNVSF
ncbi:MAG: HD domain-containing protein [Terrisporobacter sp.]|uniref:HD domain-containing protein n=1 Tax=Terrisporobacter sp. TaxID=1965305 RepID=UPI002A840C54|nr:HD domain-containing protein [Terrisporobacter sp.]MDY4734818.1 HD domain-containing protein [Terrisporobacter sp.]MDY6154205.1 HD domain-containing protein [Terrisporobacter sp.]